MRALNRLSAAQVKNCPPGKFNDGGGLWLHRRADGGAQWFLRVTVAGRRREMGLGSLADVSAEGGARRGGKVAQGGGEPAATRSRSASGSGAKRRPSGRRLQLWRTEAFEARKAQLKGDGKAGRWFSPLELSCAAEARADADRGS